MLLRKCIIIAIASLSWLEVTRGAEVKIGDTFPELSQFGLVGELPKDLKGKVVLVDFWASWCAPCKVSFPALNDLATRFGPRGLVVVGINVDESKAAMQEFLRNTPARFSVVHDAQQKLVQRVDVAAMPTSFLIDAAGKVRFIHNGFHGDKTREDYVREIEGLVSQAAR